MNDHYLNRNNNDQLNWNNDFLNEIDLSVKSRSPLLNGVLKFNISND